MRSGEITPHSSFMSAILFWYGIMNPVMEIIRQQTVSKEFWTSEPWSKLSSLMGDTEYLMLMLLAALANIPEGTTITYEKVRQHYVGIIDAVKQFQTEQDTTVHPDADLTTRNSNARLRSNLMLVEALPVIETQDKGEIYRLYDQGRRGIIAGVEREVKILLGIDFKLEVV